MKKAKILTAALTALMILSSCDAQTEPAETAQSTKMSETAVETEEMTAKESEMEKTESETTETKTETTAETSVKEEKPIFTSEEAENYYNIIMSDLFWRKENTNGATIIDLQGDGTPEFLVNNDQEYSNIDCYEFGEDKLNYLYSFDWIAAMSKYVEDGKTYWWGYNGSHESDDSGDGSSMRSYKSGTEYGLVEFTENGPEMIKVLFSSSEEYDSETDIYKGEMYINGEKYDDDYIEDYSKLDGVPPLKYYGWYIKKADWEGENLTDDNNYKLIPNSELWQQMPEIKNDVFLLVNAYCNNDKEYLTSPGYFGSVEAFKPVIYLYPEKTTEVNVGLDLDGQLTCAYPDYGNGWRVIAKPDGTLYDMHSGNEYSYLFWEASLNADWDMDEGFVVKGSDTADFLREKLSYMGLTPKEYNEFIVYWLPLMQNNKYNLITFQTDTYENAAKLEITPKPDSILRVFMAFKPLDEFEEIPQQELSTFERKGFAVVEWGGTEVLPD
ncbi:MAG: hypothetical protein ACI4SF_06920 [Oscillospiraceae bacterium]